jgi:hypothetical protein
MSTAYEENEEPVIPRERSDKPGYIRIVSAVFWPGFVISFITMAILFSMLDPHQAVAGTRFADMSVLGIYTMLFLLLWVAMSISAACTLWFLKPGLEIATPFPRSSQPGSSQQ